MQHLTSLPKIYLIEVYEYDEEVVEDMKEEDVEYLIDTFDGDDNKQAYIQWKMEL